MKVNSKDQERIILSQWIEVVIIIICIITFIISLHILSECFYKKKNIEDLKYTYDIKNNIDYKVHLFDNNFFDEKYLGMDKSYMAKLVNKIHVDYKNTLSVSKITNFGYDYTINATLVAKSEGQNDFYDSVIWTKKYILVPTAEGNLSEKTESEINIPLDIDFQFYKQLVDEFENQMKLDVNSYLDVELLINYKFYVDGSKNIDSENVNMRIPLSTSTFKIETKYDNNSKSVYDDVEVEANSIKLFGGFVLFISSIFCSIILIIILIKDTKKAEYIIKLNKILKNYGDIMAKVKKMPNLDSKEIYDITDFEDLVNIEEELKIPIIYYEKKSNKEGWFMIIHFNIVYRYILKENK